MSRERDAVRMGVRAPRCEDRLPLPFRESPVASLWGADHIANEAQP
jgi:hypothetical protein